MRFEVPKRSLVGVVKPLDLRPARDPRREVDRALSNPSGATIEELAGPRSKVAVVVTDYTRPCPDKLILPLVLDRLWSAGVKPQKVVVVVGTGAHRPMTQAELEERFGRLRVAVVNHNPHKNLVWLGKTRGGGDVYLNRRVAGAELVIGIGVVEPHQYAGFSGGRKLIAVGVAGEPTIAHTHQPKFIDHPLARPGNLKGNPFHLELLEIASRANFRFAVNVVLSPQHKLVGCFAGEPRESFELAARFASRMYVRPVGRAADGVVLGVGHPKDVDLYQASRGITYSCIGAGTPVRQGGAAILVAECREGVGNPRFERVLKEAKTPEEVLSRASGGLKPGEQRAYVLAKALQRVRAVVVGSRISQRELGQMFFGWAKTVEEALESLALGEVLVLPYSLLTIPILGRRG